MFRRDIENLRKVVKFSFIYVKFFYMNFHLKDGPGVKLTVYKGEMIGRRARISYRPTLYDAYRLEHNHLHHILA